MEQSGATYTSPTEQQLILKVNEEVKHIYKKKIWHSNKKKREKDLQQWTG